MNSRKSTSKGKRGGLKITDLSVDWKRRGIKKPTSRSRVPRSLNGRTDTNFGRGSALMLNAPQTNMTNPNRFWEMCKASTPGGICVRAREPIGSVTVNVSSASFTLGEIGGQLGFALNPQNSFPRLSAIAVAFEFYRFKRVRIDFISNQPTSAQGQMLFWVNYNPADTEAASTSEALSNITSVISNVYANQSLVMDGKLCRLDRYVTNVTSDVNPNQTIQGELCCALTGYVTSAGLLTFGEAMLEYEIEFFTPSEVQGAYLTKDLVDSVVNCLSEIRSASKDTYVKVRCDAIEQSFSKKQHRREPKVRIIKPLVADSEEDTVLVRYPKGYVANPSGVLTRANSSTS